MVRDFVASDQQELRSLILAGLQERWGDAFDARFNPDLDDFVASYLDGGAEIVVVEADGVLVATGTLLHDDRGDVGQIVRMSVAETHRRQGLGRSVVTELLARARRRGVSEVRVLTDTPWMSAVELYRSCGFTEVGRDETDTHFALRL